MRIRHKNNEMRTDTVVIPTCLSMTYVICHCIVIWMYCLRRFYQRKGLSCVNDATHFFYVRQSTSTRMRSCSLVNQSLHPSVTPWVSTGLLYLVLVASLQLCLFSVCLGLFSSLINTPAQCPSRRPRHSPTPLHLFSSNEQLLDISRCEKKTENQMIIFIPKTGVEK